MSGGRMTGWRATGAATLALAAVAASWAAAEPLPKEECEKLKLELAAMDKGGVKDALQKGPAWVRANAGAAKLKEIERYITVDEQLSFRCGLARARLTLPFAEEDQPPAAPDEAAKAEEATTPPPKPKPKPKPKAEVAPPAEKAVAQPPPAKPKPKPKPAETESPVAPEAAPKPVAKPKPKVDDAFRPPPHQGKDPFAGQVQPPSKSP